MNVIYSVKDYVSNVFHQDSGSSALDVIAVQQSNGFLTCSSFYVQFGSMQKLGQYGKQHVMLEVNGQIIQGIRMKLKSTGEAYFVHHQIMMESVDDQDYSTLPSSPSSIGNTDEVAHEHSFGKDDTALEPQDEEHGALQNQRPWMRELGGMSIVDDTNAAMSKDLSRMAKSASVYFDAVDIKAAMATGGKYVDYYDHPSMSLCGHLLDTADTKNDIHRIFFEHVITFDYFRANSASILANPALRFFVDGKVVSYDADMQAYLVSRVLFPYSQHLSVGKLQNGNEDETDASLEVHTDLKINGVMICDEIVKKSGYSCSHSALLECGPAALERLDEVCSGDAGSTQDTASITSEPYCSKSLKPSQEDLLKMGLRTGTNDISFVLQLDGVGEVARVTANLYLWPYTLKIVLAHIDGAILSTAGTGSMFKRRGPTAIHSGAAEFYSKLARNGYKVVYLTCHGILQTRLHHALFHNNSGEEEETALPMGPILLSPDRLFASYSNEIHDTQDFRAAALDDLQSLFPRGVNPFYAAFGTSQSDSVVFTQAGVFPGKVFVVDPTDGVLRHHSLMSFYESYTSLLDRIDVMFSPICSPVTMLVSSFPQSSDRSVVKTPQPISSNLSTVSRAIMVKDDARIASKVVASLVCTRSLTDEAYNDINFWRLKPGHV